ncbi:hypothetical protein N0V90_004029 [Kalmusia sp. IMI 367209]|nr:hypothetical protein N0V90_004029 [Kalmusia sp. IMI 367209]
MRRWRNVATATLILVTIVYFVAQQQDKLPDAYQFGVPFQESVDDEFGNAASQQSSASLGNSEFTQKPPEIEVQPPPVLPNGDTPQEETPPTPASDLSGLPPSDDAQLPPVPDQAPVAFQPEFSFQQDLDLELPVDSLKSFSNNKAHNYDPNGPASNVYATFMATRNPSLKDPYYMAVHSLIYRVLWSPRSRTEKYAFVVFVGDFVTAEQRQLLTGAGAIVRELAPLEWNPNVEGIQHRWKDLFAKLNMWKETDFFKILFLDADAFPVNNIDAMFDLAPQKTCIESKLAPEDHFLDGTSTCEPYVFAGVPQNPGDPTNININVGSMVFSPSTLMHQRLLQNYLNFDKYDVTMAEQAFLNWQFSINGAFPATTLDREWGAAFPQEDEEGKLKVVHEKLWSDERAWFRREWGEVWIEMTQFYMGDDFRGLRASDGVA